MLCDAWVSKSNRLRRCIPGYIRHGPTLPSSYSAVEEFPRAAWLGAGDLKSLRASGNGVVVSSCGGNIMQTNGQPA